MCGVPLTVIAFVLLTLQIPIGVVLGDDLNATVAAALVMLAVLLVFLSRGSRAAWTFWFLLAAFAVLVQPLDPAPWWAWALNFMGLVLLLAPATREHVWGTKALPKRPGAVG